jgi:hypothetical protein
MLASDGAKCRIFQLTVCVRKNLNIFHPKFVGWAKFPPDSPSARPEKRPFRTCLPAGKLDDFKFFFGGKLLCKKR